VNNNNSKGKVTVLGIDLAKNSFQLHGVDEKGNKVLKKKLTRKQLVAFIAQLPPCLIGIEACGGAHHWGVIHESTRIVYFLHPQVSREWLF
jgi:hypothetical protein